ncbi:MAG: hypothetical protein U0W24_04665 [Bacteroidales bacterium]
MKKLNFILFVGIIFTSCEKTVIEEVEKEYSWKTHPNFINEKSVQMNSFSTDNSLYFFGLYTFSAYGTNSIDAEFLDPISGVTMNNYFHIDHDQPTQYKFPISNNFFIEYKRANGYDIKDDQLCFISAKNPYYSYTYIKFSIKDIDPSFLQYYFSIFTHDECIAINNKNQALIPYSASGISNSKLKFALVNIKVDSTSYSNMVYLDTVKTKLISLNDDNQYDPLYIQHLGEDFFLTTNTKTYRINSAGEIAQMYDYHFYDIIEKHDTTYSVGYNFNLKQYEWSYSIDKGKSWTMVSKILNQFECLDYTVINNRIIGFCNSQIWEIKPTSYGIESIELENDGLEGKLITAISSFKGNVYVSSLSGVFYKTLDDFFKIKKI